MFRDNVLFLHCGVICPQVTVMQVKATSPLTHNISGTAKAAAQVRNMTDISK